MLGLKSYRSAATTFAGIELAHRIRKGQFSMPVKVQGRTSTLKDLWNRALDCLSELAGQSGGQIPSMHQISASRCPRGPTRVPRPGGRRCPRKIFFGRSLYLLVMPKGGRYGRYRYRYGGKDKTLALGALPDVPPERTRARHQAARQWLAAGIDPALKRRELRCVAVER
jgi:hypothetical protein